MTLFQKAVATQTCLLAVGITLAVLYGSRNDVIVVVFFGVMFSAIGLCTLGWVISAYEFQQWNRREIERQRRQPFGMPVNLTPGRGETWSGPRE